MKIIIVSFGYKFGTPEDADLLIDARQLPNPFNKPELRSKSGLDDAVWTFVAKTTKFSMWKNKAVVEVRLIIRDRLASGAAEVSIGVGCVGGRHRSVVGCLEIARALWWTFGKSGEHQITVAHRDIQKGGPVGNIMTAKQLMEEFKKPYKKFNPQV